ncbi:MAG: exo-alpha-sialidase [Lachnospiraceae bacterium]|nr:exo-alpha-sialidase [Lachnospiraceae bacterium]
MTTDSDTVVITDEATTAAEEVTLPAEGEILSLDVPHFSDVVVTASTTSSTTGTKPDDGTTTGQPFTSGTGGSTNFRIPAMVTLDDGTIVAAADARWDNTADGYGLDTIVSYSTDNGETWNYTFANYLGDNGNCYNTSSTAFIDPSLATDGETVYMLVDLYPGGTVISNAQAGTGYDSDGYLMLKKSGDSGYDYYLGDFGSDGYAYIYNYSTDTAVGGYTVDQWFNVYVQGTLTSNLFYSDCTYTVLPTSYLYLTTSMDGGATWSAPTMLNSQVKNSDDEFYGVGPGTGLVTSTGRIIFSCYTYVTSDGNTSVIYSDDGGKIWTRSDDMSAQSSEATMVEADGTIYMFTRHGGYYYSTDNGSTWSSKQTVSGISYNTSCQINAMVYSKKIDGKTAILLSAPGNTSSRYSGKIFVGLVQNDGSISWDYTYSVNGSSYYAYSCLAELSDGTIALLYESNSATITYTTIDIADIASGATIGTETTVTDEETGITATAVGLTSISVTKGDTVTNDDGSISIYYDITLNDGAYTDAAVVTIPVDDAFTEAGCVSYTAVVYNDSAEDADDVDVTISDDETTLTLDVPHFSTVLVTGTTSGDSNGLTATSSNSEDVTVYVGYTTTITDTTGNYEGVYDATNLDTSIATVTVTGTTTTGSGETSWVEGDVTEGTAFLISNGTYYLYYTTRTQGQSTSYNINSTTSQDSATEWYMDSDGHIYTTINGATYYLNRSNNGLSLSTSASTSWTYSNGAFSCSVTTSSGGWGGSTTTTTYYLTYSSSSYGNSGWTTSTSSSTLKTYIKYTEPAESYETTIDITGVAVGTTTVIVGNTVYNITVLDPVDSFHFTSGTGTGSGSVVTKLYISKGLEYELDLDSDVLESGYTVEWSSVDDSIATVDEDGTVTAVSEGETTIMATVTLANGETQTYTITVVVRDDGITSSSLKYYDFYITEITDSKVFMGILYGTSNSNVVADDLIEVVEGEAIYIAFESNAGTAVDFFGRAKDGYVLTFMDAPSGQGDYLSLEGDAPADTEFITTSNAAGANQVTAFGSTVVYELVQKALDENCKGGLGFTRASGSTGNASSTLSFRSEQLPTVEKEITYINGTEYTEGMAAAVGDTITYTITVTKYASTSGITYSNATLTDTISNDNSSATFVDSGSTTKDITEFLNKAGNDEATVSYTVTYEITTDDYNTYVTNTVTLECSFKAEYSSGTYSGSAEAIALLEVPSFEGKDLVVDYGLPVSYTYPSWNASVTSIEKEGDATYGDVTVTGNSTDGWTVTYTPTTVLLDVDTVTMYNSDTKTAYSFNIYPATTVYYEEGFATYGTGWSVTSGGSWSNTTTTAASSQQVESVTTDSDSGKVTTTANGANYNYDSAYSDDTTGSNGTAASTTAAKDSLSYTFTGTGTDIFANCKSDSGIVCIMVKNSSGSTEKLLIVDMANTGTYESGGTAYNTPIASISGLTPGTHTVTIYLSSTRTSGFEFDGFRVYGTIDEASNTDVAAIYTYDNEDDPSYYELRNYVLKAVSASSSDYADDIATGVAQVYATSETDSISAIVSYSDDIIKSTTDSESGENTSAQTLLDEGPKNELYLYDGSSVVFKINTDRQVQIGLRSVSGDSMTCTITDGNGTVIANYTISSSVDMFYDLHAKGGTSGTTYKITVSGDGILSITDLKVSDSVGDIFGTLTEEEVVAALTGTAADSDEAEETEEETEETEPEVVYAYAELDICLADASGETIASTALSEYGVDGETATFSADAILAQAESVLPDGYSIDESTVSEQTVACGECADVTISVNKLAMASLEIQLVDYRKKTVASTSLTSETGVEGAAATFTASEILEAVNASLPDGYAIVNESSITDQTAVYGGSGSVSVQIGKVAALQVTFQMYSGLFRTTTVGTATLTKVQTSSADTATFSASEISAAVPDGYRVLISTSSRVKYGSTATKTLTVYKSGNTNSSSVFRLF